MADMVIQGPSAAAVPRIDADARARGLSRQQYLLHQRFEREGSVTPPRCTMTHEDLSQACAAELTSMIPG
ncbi:hypothetical protein [Mycolicibacterium sp.]|uniref:hypothetical protein n=1 Tax=Mycolicibacterium sp. TaxID=2320850 RepID=UPI0025CEA935|nr:hypothetical protein [Mycolicibacterium sp.]